MWQYTGLAWPFAVSLLIALALLFVAWGRREVAGARAFMVLMGLAALWAYLSMLQVLIVPFPAKVLISEVRYVAIGGVPVAWGLFALSFGGFQGVLRARWIALLAFVPAITLVMVATNEQHGWMFADTFPERAGALTTVGRLYGPWFWVHWAYSVALLLGGVLVLVWHRLYGPPGYRRQTTVMIIGALCPLAVNAVFVSVPDLFGHLDLTPVTFSLAGVFFAWGLFRYHLLDLVPLPRAALIEHLPDAVLVVDEAGRLLDANVEARRILGAHAPGTPLADVAPAFVPLVARHQQDRHVTTEEVALPPGPEGGHTYDVRLAPLHTRYGTYHGAMLVLRDVTLRTETEAELRRAKRESEEMSRLKSVLLANMSHEIRTPLTAILGFATLLEEEVEEEQRSLVAFIRTSGDRLLETLNTVLDLARLEAGDLRAAMERCDVRPIVKQVARLFAEAAEEKGLTLHVEDVEAAVWGDRAMLARALRHLVSNAVKFTSEGEVRIRVEVEDEAVRIHVVDTGIGIAPDFLPVAFEAFQQESSGSTRSHEGSGLGLSVAQGFVRAMGGSLEVESTPDAGSRFTLTLARYTDPPPDHGASTRPRLLVVAATAFHRDLLERVLQPLGDVDTAADLEAGAAWAEANGYDLIVIDDPEGVTGGASSLQKLRTLPGLAPVPLLGVAPAQHHAYLVEDGFAACIDRPFRPAALTAAVNDLLAEAG